MRSAFRFPLALVVGFLVAQLFVPARADVRLDSRVAPVYQEIVLDLDANRTEYTGSVRTELKVTAPTSEFLFHAEEMSLDKVVLSDAKGPIGVTIEEGEEGIRRVTCERELSPGAYTLAIDFSKDYNTRAVGLYRMMYEGQGYLFTQFEDVDARKGFPCWDEPIYKIPYQLTVTIPTQQEVVSNTPVEKETRGAGTKTYHFKKTPPMSSYLIAIAAGPLESVAIPGLSVPGRIYTVKGQKGLTGLAAEYAPPILDALEKYFGRKYPYEKLDLVAVPEYWPGAMENPGCITYKDGILLVDPEAAGLAQKRFLARVHAHEFAHMWFGDLVTMAWWDDLWLNESFADWMGDKITEQLFPEFKLAVSELQDVQHLMEGDARPSTVPVRKPVETSADRMNGVMLAYGKGKTVLHMVEVWIGEDAFQKGVREYINENEWKNTTADDLFRSLSEAAGQDITPVLSTFLDQPGFPIVTLDVPGDGLIRLSQTRFHNYGVEAPDLSWSIPVRIKYSDGEKIHVRSVLLDKETMDVEVGTHVDWAMPNEGSYGYYRWSAPVEMMFRIAKKPMENLDERERATFLANAHSLLDSGELSGDDYLALLGEFASYPEPEIVNGVMDALGGVSGAFVTEDLRGAFAHYVVETLQPAWDRYGANAKEGESDAVKLMRPRLVAWMGGPGRDAGAREQCRKIVASYEADPASVDASLAGSALRVAAIDGSEEEFDHYYEVAMETEVPAERARYLSALGYFENPKLQERALGVVAQGTLRPNEVFPVIQGIGRTEAGHDRLFKWMTEHYDEIAQRMPPMMMAYMPYFASGCSQERLAAARAFFSEPDHTVSGTDQNLEKVADQVNDCTSLREREGGAVADYLSKLAAR